MRLEDQGFYLHRPLSMTPYELRYRDALEIIHDFAHEMDLHPDRAAAARFAHGSALAEIALTAEEALKGGPYEPDTYQE